MTKKEFVLQVVEQLTADPRAVLAGHRINSAVLQTIVGRPDVMSKLASVLYSLKTAKKGATGLKRANNFRIAGYRSFGEFNAKAREDVEEFVGGLPADDAAKFTNADNILTILMLPSAPSKAQESLEAEIITGQSVAVTFDSAVRKEYKIAGGIYLTIMIGDSAVRPAEEKIAVRKEKVNKVKQTRRTPGKIKSELKAKASKKLAVLDAKRKELEETAFATQKQLEQLAVLGNEFGAKQGSARSLIGKMGATTAKAEEIKAVIAGLTPEQKKLFSLAMKYKKAGKNSLARSLAKEIGIAEVTDAIMGGAPQGANEILKSRKIEITNKIKALVARNEELLAKLETADGVNERSIRSMISKNNSAIKAYRAKLGTYKNLSPAALINKAKMLKETHDAIQANINAGATIVEALNAALAKLDAKQGEKQIIKQQIIQQVNDGMPVQYAVQQALQQNIGQQVTAGLDTDSSLDSIIAKLL